MDNVGIRELRQNLSIHLRRVAAGEWLRVTEHGRPVAVLGPLPPDDHPLADLVATGEVIPARTRLAALGPPLQSAEGALPLSESLRQLRDEEER